MFDLIIRNGTIIDGTGRDRFEDAVVRVVHGSAGGAVLDGESVRVVVLGGGEGVIAVAARRVALRGCNQDGLVEAEGEPHRSEDVAGERVGLRDVLHR